MKKHLRLIIVVAAVALIGGYFGWRKLSAGTTPVRYVVAAAEKGLLVTTVSGSGQVSTSNQIELKPRASGDVLSVAVKEGDVVKAGTSLIQLDARDALKAVRDAEVSLDSAVLSLAKLTSPADALSVIQAENALAQAKESKVSAQEDLTKAYEDGYNDVADAFLELPDVAIGLDGILHGLDLSPGQWNSSVYHDSIRAYDEDKARLFRDDAEAAYAAAKSAYDGNFSSYKATARSAGPETISALIGQTYVTSQKLADAVKAANNLIQLYKDKLTERGLAPKPQAEAHLAALSTHTGKATAHISALLSASRAVQSAMDAIVSADRSITERAASFQKLKDGPDSLDIRSAELSVAQRRNALADAREKLGDYAVRAPFDGVIADVAVKKGDAASSGAAVLTLITTQKMATVSLNEIDAAKIAVGQRATLTFDAVPDLGITGVVASVDAIGAASQGVVTYGVEIAFDTQDERVRPGMTASAGIVTASRADVLLVPNAAVKTQNGETYVEVLDAEGGTPRRVPVETGLSNDESVEILSGLKEGDAVVTRTIQPGASATPAAQPQNAFRIPGGGMGGGGNRVFFSQPAGGR